jgi:ankyrin repeat protein
MRVRPTPLAAGLAAVIAASCTSGDQVQPAPAVGSSAVSVTTQPDPDLDAALIDASWNNDVVEARRLIAAGADVNAKDATEQNAFLIAASEGYLELLELTLDNGADVTILDSYNGTALIRAAERGHAPIVGRLLQTDIAVDHVNRLGWTALHEAIVLGDGTATYVDTVRLLVAGGADLQLPPVDDGIAPVEHARRRNQDIVVETLETSLAPPPADPNDALHEATANGDADAVAVALRAGAAIEYRDGNDRTPLLVAAAADHVEVASVLVALGADPDAIDDRSDTPWLVTGVTGSVAMAEILLTADPDLTIRNRFGGISIIPASERGHVDYVRWVVTTGIDVNHVNNLGWTALLEAVILGDGSEHYQQIVAILLAAGADPNLADNDGVTALEHARARGQDVVAAILDRAT